MTVGRLRRTRRPRLGPPARTSPAEDRARGPFALRGRRGGGRRRRGGHLVAVGRRGRLRSAAAARRRRRSRRRRHRRRPRPRRRTERSRSRPSATRCSGSRPPCRRRPGRTSAGCAPRSRGDVVFGNLEGTLTDATASKCGGAPVLVVLRVPRAARVRPRSAAVRLHRDLERQQPLLRLRPGRRGRHGAGAPPRPGSPRPACPARSRSSARRPPDRVPRLRAVPEHRLADRPAGRAHADPPRRPQGRPRRRAPSTPAPRARPRST